MASEEQQAGFSGAEDDIDLARAEEMSKWMGTFEMNLLYSYKLYAYIPSVWQRRMKTGEGGGPGRGLLIRYVLI